MEPVELVHDEPRIAPMVAQALRSQGYAVTRVWICESREDLERVKREANAPLVIRTAYERSGLVFQA